MFKGLFSSSAATPNAEKALSTLLESMIASLVDEPSKVELTCVGQDEELISFELRVAKDDLGKVIGRKGRTASAMRTILSAASRKYKVGADLKIVE